MTHLPDAVKIGPVVYGVERFQYDKERSDRLGDASYHEGKIGIGDGLKPDVEASVLMHEIVHIVLFSAGENDMSSNEGLVERLSMLLTGVLLDNGDVLDYFAEVASEQV